MTKRTTRMMLFALVILLALPLVNAETSNVTYNYVWNSTSWIPWLATADGRPKVDINLFNVTAGSMAVDTNTLYVDSTNHKVGIGLTNPSSTFQVTGTSTISGGLNVSTGGLLVAAGNVGIGTFSPAALLHLAGTNSVNNLSLNVNNTLYVNNSNVGIGTTSPAALLHLAGTNSVNNLSLNVNNTLYVNGSNVGIGTTSPSGLLHIVGPTPTKVIALIAGTSWTVPSDWNNNSNSIEVIGAGGGGTDGGDGGGGGGGGAYSRVANVSFTSGATVNISVGVGVTSGTVVDSYVCNSTSNCASIAGTAVVVGAKSGAGHSSTTGGAGGAASSGVGTIKYSGGKGGNGGGAGQGAGGGGGAAGPSGNGYNGSANSGTTGGAGNTANAGLGGAGGAGGAPATAGAVGSAATEFDSTHGSGGGGGGAGNDGSSSRGGGSGSNYGGGQGGGVNAAWGGWGVSGAGLIYIRYTPNSNTTYLYVNAGNVGIGTTSPTVSLEVKGYSTGAIVAKFTDGYNTSCYLTTGGTITCSSDARLKKNIESINYGLDTVMALRPVNFNWKYESDGTIKSLGFVAQDVEQIMPKLVMTDSDGYKELNTIGIVPVLTKAVQELNTQMKTKSETQQKEIDDLKARIAALENKK